MRMHRFCILAFLGLALASASGERVRADTISYSGSIPLALTNWTSSVTVPKFNPALGTLDGITFELAGYVEGDARFESLDRSPATITMNLQSTITLQRPDLSTVLVVIPVASTSDVASAFDLVVDFAGTSGKSYLGLSATLSQTAVSPPPISDLALFTGLGNITLPVKAVGTSFGGGAGNLILWFTTHAAAGVKVTYDYTPRTVPEPAALVGLISLGAAFGLMRLRRK